MTKFPFRLYDMLEDAERDHFEHIVSWINDGTSFRVHDRGEFVRCIAPKHFKQQTRFKSFQRQLNLYHFKTLKPENKMTGIVSHPFLRRGYRSLCASITRKTEDPSYPAHHGNTMLSAAGGLKNAARGMDFLSFPGSLMAPQDSSSPFPLKQRPLDESNPPRPGTTAGQCDSAMTSTSTRGTGDLCVVGGASMAVEPTTNSCTTTKILRCNKQIFGAEETTGATQTSWPRKTSATTTQDWTRMPSASSAPHEENPPLLSSRRNNHQTMITKTTAKQDGLVHLDNASVAFMNAKKKEAARTDCHDQTHDDESGTVNNKRYSSFSSVLSAMATSSRSLSTEVPGINTPLPTTATFPLPGSPYLSHEEQVKGSKQPFSSCSRNETTWPASFSTAQASSLTDKRHPDSSCSSELSLQLVRQQQRQRLSKNRSACAGAGASNMLLDTTSTGSITSRRTTPTPTGCFCSSSYSPTTAACCSKTKCCRMTKSNNNKGYDDSYDSSCPSRRLDNDSSSSSSCCCCSSSSTTSGSNGLDFLKTSENQQQRRRRDQQTEHRNGKDDKGGGDDDVGAGLLAFAQSALSYLQDTDDSRRRKHHGEVKTITRNNIQQQDESCWK